MPGLKPATLDRLDDEVERGAGAGQVGGEAALVAEAGVLAGLLQLALERVVDLGAPAQGLGEALGADRQDHELLDVEAVVGVRAAVDDVHQRHRQDVRVRSAEVAEQRQVGGVGGGLGDRERDAEDRVRAELRLVVGAVGLDQLGVDEALVGGVEALDRRAELVDHVVDGLEHALAEVAALVAVAQLVGLERAGGCAGGDGGAGDGAVVEQDLDLDGRVAAGVEDLAGADSFDGRHGDSWKLRGGGAVQPSEGRRAARTAPHDDGGGIAARLLDMQPVHRGVRAARLNHPARHLQVALPWDVFFHDRMVALPSVVTGVTSYTTAT